MGVDAVLYRVHQQGTSPRRRRFELLGMVVDTDGILARLPETHPGRFTSRIDPYGDAFVHGEEFADLVEDLTAIRDPSHATTPTVLAKVADLVRAHVGERGIELHLTGD